MSQVNSQNEPQKRSFIVRYHDLFPLLVLAFMAGTFLLYWKAPADSWQTRMSHQFFLPLANFFLFAYLILAKTMPMLAKHFRERHTKIAEGIQAFSQQTGAMAERFEEIEKKLENVDEESKEIIERAKTLAEQEKENVISNAKSKAEKIGDEAEASLAQELRRMQQAVQKEAVEQSFAEAQEIVKKHFSAEDQQRLEKEYLQTLGKLTSAIPS